MGGGFSGEILMNFATVGCRLRPYFAEATKGRQSGHFFWGALRLPRAVHLLADGDVGVPGGTLGVLEEEGGGLLVGA